MIDYLFEFATDKILVRVDGNTLTFGNTSQGAMMATLDGIKLSKSGVIKEFPELKDDPDWHKKAIANFKAKIKAMPNEIAVGNYVLEDLKKHGYKPLYRQISGRRVEKL